MKTKIDFTKYTPQMLRDQIEIELQKCDDAKQASYNAIAFLNNLYGVQPMQKASQLEIGTRIESEHKDTFKFIKDYYKKHGKYPPEKEVYSQIAKDHISEFKDYYTRLIAMEKQAEQDMEKARVTKYVRRIPKPSGKGYIYFYTKADYDKYKKIEKVSQPDIKTNTSFLSRFIAWFSFSEKDQAIEKLNTDYRSSKVDSIVTFKEWLDHVKEYFNNKDKWDSFFGQKEPKPVKKTSSEKFDTKKVNTDKKPAKVKLSVMKIIHDLYAVRPEKIEKPISMDKDLTPQQQELKAEIIASTLNLDYKKEWEEKNKLNLLGQNVKTNKDLAYLAQSFRNPQFETFRMVMLDKNDKVVAQTGISSRLPEVSQVFIDPKDQKKSIEHIKEIMKKSKAVKYYLIHNHPSGEIDASNEDLIITARFNREIKGMVSHIIVNHNKYNTLVMPDGGEFEDDIDELSFDLDSKDVDNYKHAELPHKILGEKIYNPDAIMTAVKTHEVLKDKMVTVLALNSRLLVQGVMNVPSYLFKNENILKEMKEFGVNMGAARLAVVDNADSRVGFMTPEKKSVYKKGVEDGYFMEVLSSAGESIRSQVSIYPKNTFSLGVDLMNDIPEIDEYIQKPTINQKKEAIEKLPKEKKDKVQSDNFKNWFGDWENNPDQASKVVNKFDIPEEQKPIVVYHGTARGGFTEFSKNKSQGGIYGSGFYFTEDEGIAKEYTKKDTESPYDKFNMVDKILDSKGNEILFDKVLLREIWNSDKVAADKSRAAGKYVSGQGVISDNPNYNKYFEKMIDNLDNKKYSISQLLEKYQSMEIENPYGGGISKPSSDGKTPIISSIDRHFKNAKEDISFKEYPPQVYDVFLNIKNPCDMDKPISMDMFKSFQKFAKDSNYQPYMDDILNYDFWEKDLKKDYAWTMDKYDFQDFVKIRDKMRSQKFSKDREETPYSPAVKKGDNVFPVMHINKSEDLSWAEFQYILTNNQKFSDAGKFTGIIQNMGFDGISHTGGYNIGTKDHKVWIAFEPNQIKSTKAEIFDPNETDMFKATKNLTKLIKKVIINKKGQQQTVYVKPLGQPNEWLNKFVSFFNFKSTGEANQRIEQDYKKFELDKKGVTWADWKNHVSEYFSNKDKWDKFFTGKAAEKKETEKKEEVKAKKSEKKPVKQTFKLSLMRTIAGLYGKAPEKVEEPVKAVEEPIETPVEQENNFETMPEVEPEPETPEQKKADVKIEKAINEATPENRNEVEREILNIPEPTEEVKPPKTEFKPKDISITIPFYKGGDPKKFDGKDYTDVVPKDIYLTREKTILTDPKPSYIPEVSDYYFNSEKNFIPTVKLGEDKYLMKVNDERKIFNTNQKGWVVEGKEEYIIVNRDVLAATQDYYFKRAKALQKKHDDEYDEKYGRKYKRKRIQMIGENRMTYPQGNLINSFIFDDRGRSNTWKMYREIRQDLKQKLEDMEIQLEDYYNTHAKGRETAYGDKGTKDTLLNTYGIKVKRQNGAEITDAEIGEIKDAITDVYSVFGDRSSMAKSFGLKISHAGDTRMHARKAVGLFMPSMKAIGVSAMYGDKGTGFILAHEWGHFMDFYLGDKSGRHYKSDDPEHTAGKIADTFRKNMKTVQKSVYQNRTCECFARAMEQYWAIKTDNKDLMAEWDSGNHPTETVFAEKVMPLIDQFLTENEQLLKAFHKGIDSKNKVFIKKYNSLTGKFEYRKVL